MSQTLYKTLGPVNQKAMYKIVDVYTIHEFEFQVAE